MNDRYIFSLHIIDGIEGQARSFILLEHSNPVVIVNGIERINNNGSFKKQPITLWIKQKHPTLHDVVFMPTYDG